MPVYYFYGDDTYQARQAIDVLAEQQHAAIRWLDQEAVQEKSVADHLGQQTGLFGAALPVIRDVNRFSKKIQADIATYLATHPGQVTAVLWDRESSRPPAALSKLAQPRQFLLPAGRELEQWIQQLVAQQGGAIAPDSARLLLERIGPDRWRLKNVLEKMLLTATTITPAVIAAEADSVSQAEIFSTLSAILRRQKKQALDNIAAILAAGQSELYILTMLAWQFKVLVQVKRHAATDSSPAAIARHTKLKPYVIEKSLPYVRTVSLSQLVDTLTKILAADWAIKQGKVEARTGLYMTALNLLRP